MVHFPAKEARPQNTQGLQLYNHWIQADMACNSGNQVSSPDLPVLFCLLSPCRWPKYNRWVNFSSSWHVSCHRVSANSIRYTRDYHPERLGLLFLFANHIPRHYTGCLFYHIHIWVLVHSTLLQVQNKDHVPIHQFLQRFDSFLGYAGTVDQTYWVP